MPYYIMEEMLDINKTGKRILYPRLAMIQQVSTEELARQISHSSSFSPGDIEGIIRQTAVELAHMMADGHSVKLEGIGTFTPSLALRTGKEREEADENKPHHNAQSIVVGNVNFRVDTSLVRHINRRCHLERAPWKHARSPQKSTPQERLAMVLKYLNEHPFLTVYEYQKLTGMMHTSAANELKEWAHTPGSGIDIAGRGVHRVYIRKKETEEYDPALKK